MNKKSTNIKKQQSKIILLVMLIVVVVIVAVVVIRFTKESKNNENTDVADKSSNQDLTTQTVEQKMEEQKNIVKELQNKVNNLTEERNSLEQQLSQIQNAKYKEELTVEEDGAGEEAEIVPPGSYNIPNNE